MSKCKVMHEHEPLLATIYIIIRNHCGCFVLHIFETGSIILTLSYFFFSHNLFASRLMQLHHILFVSGKGVLTNRKSENALYVIV